MDLELQVPQLEILTRHILRRFVLLKTPWMLLKKLF